MMIYDYPTVGKKLTANTRTNSQEKIKRTGTYDTIVRFIGRSSSKK